MSLAARGQRDLDGGVERIENPAERRQVRRQARRVYAQSLGFAAAVTLLITLL